MKTLLVIKPDVVESGTSTMLMLLGRCVERTRSLVDRAFFRKFGEEFWRDFYREHDGKPFFEGLVDFMCSGYSLFVVLDGEDVVRRLREVLGPSDPQDEQAPDYKIRRTFGSKLPRNAAHGSDSTEAAEREIALLDHYVGSSEESSNPGVGRGTSSPSSAS